MAEVPREFHFSQAGDFITRPSGVSRGGLLDLDTVYDQADYPLLFAEIGITYNDSGKGDNDITQFRTPESPPWVSGSSWVAYIKF